MEHDHEIDLSGLNCPLPILRTKAALTKVASGEVLRITVTNPDSVREIDAFAKQSGGSCEHEELEKGAHYLYFRKA